MRCADCESFQTLIFDETELYFWFPLSHARDKFRAVRPIPAQAVDPIAVRVSRAEVGPFLTELAGIFTPEEIAGIKVLSQPAGEAPNLADMGRVVPLERLMGAHHAAWLVDMITAERYTSLYQPIVHAGNVTPFAHEALFRGFGEDGAMINPGYMFDLAGRAGMLFQLDLAARRSAVTRAAHTPITEARLFINFNPSSIYDPAYCLRTTATAIAECGFRPEQIVFEVVESDEIKNIRHLKGILAFYRSAGFKIALDDVGAGYASLNMLQDLWPDFLKIDMQLVRGVDTDRFRQSIIRNILAIARENSIRVVAEGIETDGEMAWLREIGVDYLQGFKFGRPRPATEISSLSAA